MASISTNYTQLADQIRAASSSAQPAGTSAMPGVASVGSSTIPTNNGAQPSASSSKPYIATANPNIQSPSTATNTSSPSIDSGTGRIVNYTPEMKSWVTSQIVAGNTPSAQDIMNHFSPTTNSSNAAPSSGSNPVSQPQQSNSANSSASTDTDSGTDYAAQMRQAIAEQQAATAAMYQQQAEQQAEQIRQAVARQIAQANATKEDYTNQTNAAIQTWNTQRDALPGQVTTENNQASANGVASAQHIRSALAQMGLLQSGESASQQLANDATVGNNINANNLAGQQLDAQYVDKIAAAQTDLASKTKAINDAIAQAQANGDTNALEALKTAQAQTNAAIAANNAALNNAQTQLYQFGVTSGQTQQQIDNQASQLGLTKAQFLAQLRQWALGYNADLAQQGFNNGVTVGNLTGNYGGDISTGTPQVTVNPDGTISTIPVTTDNPTTATTLDISGNPVIEGSIVTGPTGITWNNYPIVGPNNDAPPTNPSGATLTGYRLVATTNGKKYYMPIYSDQLPAGSVPTGAKTSGKKNGVPVFKGV